MLGTIDLHESQSAWDDLAPEEFEALVAAATDAAHHANAGGTTHAALPAAVDDLPPGPLLMGVLAGVEIAALDGHDRVVALRAHARMAAHCQAQMYAAMAAIARSMRDIYGDPVTGAQSAAAEVQLALTLTRRAADSELALGLDLIEALPEVWARLASGAIDRRRAQTIVHGTAHLPTTAARDVARGILDQAGELTTGQIAARLRRLCLEADPDDAARRYVEAVADRRIVVEQNPSGTGNLHAMDLPADRAAAIRRHIHELAKGLKVAGETRSMDQLRTDVFLDLLDGSMSCSASPRGVVDIHVQLDTLVELTKAPGDLSGFGPVIADIARQIVAESDTAEWRWNVIDHAGRPIAGGITARRPTAAMRRHIERRYRTCIFPGCRMPATRSDIDHRIPWAESRRTRTHDLAPLCRHHHIVRHLPGWSYRLEPDGAVTWHTPLRHAYTRRGPP